MLVHCWCWYNTRCKCTFSAFTGSHSGHSITLPSPVSHSPLPMMSSVVFMGLLDQKPMVHLWCWLTTWRHWLQMVFWHIQWPQKGCQCTILLVHCKLPAFHYAWICWAENYRYINTFSCYWLECTSETLATSFTFTWLTVWVSNSLYD
jgi:hypothetical protein